MNSAYDFENNKVIIGKQMSSVKSEVATQAETTTAESAAPAGKVAAQPASPLGTFLPFLVLFAAFYFLMIRPGQKKEKKRKEKINSIKKDDRVVTIGGIVGKVVNVETDEVVLVVEDKSKIRFKKSAIADVNSNNESAVEIAK